MSAAPPGDGAGKLHPSRRVLLQGALGASAGLGLSALPLGCAAEPTAQPAPGTAACESDAVALDASAGADARIEADTADTAAQPCPSLLDLASVPDGKLDVAGAKLPYRQHDPLWGADLMWDRDKVIAADVQFNGQSPAVAASLLREFDDGNNLANEGCMLTCLAMVMRLLNPDTKPKWTPKVLNKWAHDLYYYTPCGLSMTTLSADLMSELTAGEVQLCLKEEYLPGEAGWPKMRTTTSALVRAYRVLPPEKRSNFMVMLKTGTYDETVASHYVLLHPGDASSVDDPNPEVLDPAQPLGDTKPWRLTDSAAAILEDPEIAAGWKASGIDATQIGGVWVFTRWAPGHDRSLLTPLVQAWALELAKLG